MINKYEKLAEAIVKFKPEKITTFKPVYWCIVLFWFIAIIVFVFIPYICIISYENIEMTTRSKKEDSDEYENHVC